MSAQTEERHFEQEKDTVPEEERGPETHARPNSRKIGTAKHHLFTFSLPALARAQGANSV